MTRGAGPYSPESWMWRVNRETALLAAGPRALLMQLAHPLVAAGVAAHSRLERDPLGRLVRTLDRMLARIFGDDTDAAEATRDINVLHAAVRGRLPRDAGGRPAGTPYSAADPDLLFWVHATLVDSALVAYERLVEPLAPEARESFYRDSRHMGPPLGLCYERMPETFAAFRSEVDDTLACLQVSDDGRRLAEIVLSPPLRWLPPALPRVARAVTLAWLPEPLRAAYALPEAPGERARGEAWLERARRMRPWLPGPLRVVPHARRAEARLRRSAPADRTR